MKIYQIAAVIAAGVIMAAEAGCAGMMEQSSSSAAQSALEQTVQTAASVSEITETTGTAENIIPETSEEKQTDPETETVPETPDSNLEGEEVSETVYATTDDVNIRTYPDTSASIAGTTKKKDAFTCTKRLNNGWLQVLYNEATCYVYGEYFSTEEPTEPETTVPETTAIVASAGTGIYYAGSGPLVAIDAGHQLHGDSNQEPNGPGSSVMKARVTSGTQGVATGVPEYQLNLAVALKLRDALLAQGYSVLMIRETNEVSISNAERAELANQYGAAIFLRIHANGSENQSVRGTLTMAPSTSNVYCSSIASSSQTLSQLIVNNIAATTGFNNQGVMITDTMTGINWCQMPVSIIEMGYMSNADEDQAMQTDAVQNEIVQGIVAGVNSYFGR